MTARPRIGKRAPKDKTLRTRERDINILLAHSPQTPLLTREYIAALIGQADSPALRQRIFALIQEGGFLYRPPFQLNSQYFYRKTITALTDAGKELLRSRGLDQQEIANKGEHDLHRLMRSTIHASMKLAVEATGTHFYSLDHILSHPKCPERTREAKSPLTFTLRDGATLTPDDIWRWRTDVNRTFFVEIDRGTEPVLEYTKGDGAIETKLAGYDEILDEKLYTEVLGITDKPRILIVTLTPQRAQSILRLVENRSSNSDRVLVKHKHYCQTNGWEIPPIMPDLFTEPWQSVNGPVFLNQ